MRDPYGTTLGLDVTGVTPGWARAEMVAGPQHANFLGWVHGGAVFSLADAALAAASNSHGHQAVASTVTLHLLRPCRPGDRLVAEAAEEHRSRRLALYRVTVRREPGGDLVAVAEGQAALLEARPPVPPA